MFEEKLKYEMQNRKKYMVLGVEERTCYLQDLETNNIFHINVYFRKVQKLPQDKDLIYVPNQMQKEIKMGQKSFSFSGEIGEVFARKPHDFSVCPEEFLIVEYSSGERVLLERIYG